MTALVQHDRHVRDHRIAVWLRRIKIAIKVTSAAFVFFVLFIGMVVHFFAKVESDRRRHGH